MIKIGDIVIFDSKDSDTIFEIDYNDISTIGFKNLIRELKLKIYNIQVPESDKTPIGFYGNTVYFDKVFNNIFRVNLHTIQKYELELPIDIYNKYKGNTLFYNKTSVIPWKLITRNGMETNVFVNSTNSYLLGKINGFIKYDDICKLAYSKANSVIINSDKYWFKPLNEFYKLVMENSKGIPIKIVPFTYYNTMFSIKLLIYSNKSNLYEDNVINQYILVGIDEIYYSSDQNHYIFEKLGELLAGKSIRFV